MADTTKYVVTCCRGEVDGGRIDDNRPAGGVVIDPDHSFRVKTAVLECEECNRMIRLGRRKLDELIDAVQILQKQMGHNEMQDGRRVIPLNLLCAVNGKLPRRTTRPR
jgi:hypothetical protein